MAGISTHGMVKHCSACLRLMIIWIIPLCSCHPLSTNNETLSYRSPAREGLLPTSLLAPLNATILGEPGQIRCFEPTEESPATTVGGCAPTLNALKKHDVYLQYSTRQLFAWSRDSTQSRPKKPHAPPYSLEVSLSRPLARPNEATALSGT